MSDTPRALGNIRIICAIIFVSGIAGMIITSIAGNNVGLVNTIGGTTAIAAVVLLIATSTATSFRPGIFAEADAERLEQKISRLVKAGANENELRDLVRQATQLGRKS